MTDLSSALQALGKTLASIDFSHCRCSSRVSNEIHNAVILIEASALLEAGPREKVEQSLVITFVGANRDGMGFVSWVSEFKALKFNAIADELDAALRLTWLSLWKRWRNEIEPCPIPLPAVTQQIPEDVLRQLLA